MIDFSAYTGWDIPNGNVVKVERDGAVIWQKSANYTPLEYIESTGKEYIDTGFIANQDTRVLFDAYNLTAASSWAFGAWTGARSLQYAFSCNVDYSFRYGADNVKLSTVPVGEFHVDFNKNAYNLNGVTGTFPEQTFSCEYTMYLFAINAKGSVSSGKFTGRIYSCKIYDNGTLVRDFVPVERTSDGAIGMYDRVNNTFYGNAGSGAFIAP